jgi:hypothetical protein
MKQLLAIGLLMSLAALPLAAQHKDVLTEKTITNLEYQWAEAQKARSSPEAWYKPRLTH